MSLAALLALSLLAPGGAVAAQAGNQPDEGETVFIGQLDNTTRIVDAELANGTVTVTLESDVPKLVSWADFSASQKDSEGVETGRIRSVSIPRGRTQLTLDVEPVDGQAVVSISTNQGYAVLRIGKGSEIFDEDPTWDDARLAGLGALGGGGWLLIGAVLYVTGNYSPKIRRRL